MTMRDPNSALPRTRLALARMGAGHSTAGPRSFASWIYSIDNLGLAWILLLIGSFSFTEAPAAVALSGQINSSNVVRYACILLALVLISPELRFPMKLRLNPLWLFAAYAVVCVLSSLWSLSPVVTFGKAVELGAVTATVVFAANRVSSAKAFWQLFDITFAMGAFILLFILVGYALEFPGFWIPSNGVISRQMESWFLSANGIGYLSALTATVALERSLSWVFDRRIMFAVYMLSLTTAIIAQGRTGLFCFILGTAIALIIHRRFKLLIVGGVFAVLLAATFNEFLTTYLVRGEVAENLQTLSGRSIMWQAAWQSFLDRPLTGSGFGVGGRALFLTAFAGTGESISSVHNGFMELLTGVGLLGFAPWIVSLLWTLALAFRSGLRSVNTVAAVIMMPILVVTMMSNGAGGWFNIIMAYFLCGVAILGQHQAVARVRSS